jgi:plastocyanin
MEFLMSKSAKILIVLVVMAVIAISAIIGMGKDDTTSKSNSSTNSNSSNSQASNSSNSSDSTDEAVAATISYDGTTFSPSTTTVKAGQTVKVSNDSSDTELDFDSDPHPTHTDNPDLNAGDIDPGQSKTFSTDKTGTWGFHNHHDPSQHGELVVE